MEVLHTLGEVVPHGPTALALGAFDGLHRGHQAVIASALASKWTPGVFTFEGSPSGALALLTRKDKENLLAEVGVKELVSLAFEQVRAMPAEEFFFQVLLEKCGAKALFCGEDFRFGRGAAGDVSLLKRLCGEKGIALTAVPPVTQGGEKISSTRIRRAVKAGKIPAANELLGRPFGYTLEVIHGNHIGAELGTPTINQALPAGLILPPFGVYASVVEIDGTEYAGVTNIGVKPTVGSDRVLSETWMPAYHGDLYGRELRLALLEFIRPERKFDSLETLKQEIVKNAAQAQGIVEREKSRFPGGKILYKPGKL